MESGDVKKITVIGSGDMGNGIAEVAILAGYKVAMRDIEQRFVDRGIDTIKKSLAKLVKKSKISEDASKDAFSRLEPLLDLEKAVQDADFIIEAVPEIMDLKKSVFKELDKLSPEHTVLATNTSNMSITEIAKATNRQDKVVGMHFFNPAVLMKLVEVIKGENTSDEAVNFTHDIAEKFGKIPVIVKKDSPGFIYNRVNAPVSLLLSRIMDAGSPSPEEFDAIFKAIMPMAPFELADYVGLDVAYHSLKYFSEVLSPEYRPSKVLEDKVNSKNLGKKTGKGFYDWSSGRPTIDTSKAVQEFDITHLIALQVNEATKLLEEGVADDPKVIDLAMANGGGGGIGPFALAKNIGYDTLINKCRELADKFNVDVFKPTKTMTEGKVSV